MTEFTVYTNMLGAIQRTPHRDTDQHFRDHVGFMNQAPLFYAKLAVWYMRNGDIRDMKDVFAAVLCSSDESWLRGVGLWLLRQLPPHQVERSVSLLSRQRLGLTRDDIHPKFFNLPRSVRTEVKHYLGQMTSDDNRFQRAVLTSRKALKRLCVGTRYRTKVTQAFLFRQAPEGTLPWVVRQIRKADNHNQARLIVQHKIPYPVAVSVANIESPAVLAACIEVMTPQQLANNLQSLRNRGVDQHPDLMKLVESKIASWKTAPKKVNVGKIQSVGSGKDKLGETFAAAVDDVSADVARRSGTITRSTALLIDKSGSMTTAIRLGIELMELLAVIYAEDVDRYIYAFDRIAYPIRMKGTTTEAAKSAMRGISAGGGTSIGAPLVTMRKNKERVEQIIIVTDQEEMSSPRFVTAYEAYANELGVRPEVIIVWIRGFNNGLGEACDRQGIECTVLDYRRGDHNNHADLLRLVSKGGLQALAQEILSIDLPETSRLQD